MLLNLIPVSAFAETEDLVEDAGSMTVSGTTDGDVIVDITDTEGETDKQNAPEKDSEPPTITEETQDEAAEEGDTQEPSPDSGEEEQSTEEADGESAEEASEIRLTESSISVTLGERTITAAGLMPENAWLFAAEIPQRRSISKGKSTAYADRQTLKWIYFHSLLLPPKGRWLFLRVTLTSGGRCHEERRKTHYDYVNHHANEKAPNRRISSAVWGFLMIQVVSDAFSCICSEMRRLCTSPRIPLPARSRSTPESYHRFHTSGMCTVLHWQPVLVPYNHLWESPQERRSYQSDQEQTGRF